MTTISPKTSYQRISRADITDTARLSSGNQNSPVKYTTYRSNGIPGSINNSFSEYPSTTYYSSHSPITQGISQFQTHSTSQFPPQGTSQFATQSTSQFATQGNPPFATQGNPQFDSPGNPPFSTQGNAQFSTPSRIFWPREGQESVRSSVHGTVSRNTVMGDVRQSLQDTVLSERVVEHEVKVPKRIIREDVVEKVIVVPEKVLRESIVEEIVRVKEKIIEVAKPIIHEKIVEVPEYEYIEKIVEVPEMIHREKIREVSVTKYEERIIQQPKIYHRERIIEVPEIEYREIPIEKIVEVPEIREQIIVKEVPVTQYIDKPVPHYQTVEIDVNHIQKVPIPMESVSTFTYKVPKLQPRYSSVDLTLYVPRFIEVPVPVEFMETATRIQAEQFASQINLLAEQKSASLAEVENLAGSIRNADFTNLLSKNLSQTEALSAAWKAGRMQVSNDMKPQLTASRNYMMPAC